MLEVITKGEIERAIYGYILERGNTRCWHEDLKDSHEVCDDSCTVNYPLNVGGTIDICCSLTRGERMQLTRNLIIPYLVNREFNKFIAANARRYGHV